MKTTNQKTPAAGKTGNGSNSGKQGAVNPKKPNNDPDQTPNREVENVPSAKSGKTASEKNKIGFKK